jgi:hypothetical protein
MSQAEKWKIKKSLCVLSVHKKVVKSFELLIDDIIIIYI